MSVGRQTSLWLLGAVIIALGGQLARGQSSPAADPYGTTAAPSEQNQETLEGPAVVRLASQGVSETSDSNLRSNPFGESASQTNWVAGSCGGCGDQCSPGGVFGGADFLFVRPHFSEATAFAHASLGPAGLSVTGEELNFDYEASFRVFAGYRFEGSDTEVQFTYTRLDNHTSVDAGNPGPGQFLVDPFGNIVGTATVVDPNSALFGHQITGGDHISTDAGVTLNIYDIEVIKPIPLPCSQWALWYSFGVRIADVDQTYQSVIDSGGAFFSGGKYSVDFVGAGPRVGLRGERFFGNNRSWSLYADTYASLIVGEYDEDFSQVTTAPPFAAQQSTKIIRTVPVAEIEMGASWCPYGRLRFSAGWLFQAWFDLGTSGGKFDGFYTVTENANIMSYEGLFVRGEIGF
ncbi:MAG TPA: Lpg1974 family pore-forming outer membrane protein [Planctomycetaceae bacterium]|nr:Lpg1974 family pore-forming outer membrane protein [Planctomycetaceae bacterium]